MLRTSGPEASANETFVDESLIKLFIEKTFLTLHVGLKTVHNLADELSPVTKFGKPAVTYHQKRKFLIKRFLPKNLAHKKDNKLRPELFQVTNSWCSTSFGRLNAVLQSLHCKAQKHKKRFSVSARK